MGSEMKELVCAFPTNCIDSIQFFWYLITVMNTYDMLNIGTDQPETEVTDMALDNDNSKFMKMKIVLNQHNLILKKATCNMLF